jgi:hypothetical protein
MTHLDPDFLRERGPQTANFENIKTLAEIAKINAETGKISAERRKVDNDLQRYNTFFRLEIWKALASFGTFAVALGAVLTFLLNVCSFQTDSERKANERISALLKDFGDRSPPVRAAAAISLGPYINDPATGQRIVQSLAYLIGTEDDTQVQNAIVEALSVARERAVPPLRASIDRIVTHTVPLFTEQRELERQIKTAPAELRKELDERKSQLDSRIRGRQWALFTIALAIRDFSTCPDRADLKCVAKFDGLRLKGMELSGVQVDLKSSSFRNTILWGADLFHLDLSGVDFTGAWLNEANLKKTNLNGANFTEAHMERIKERTRPTEFAEADLTNAKFTGACLGGADFREVPTLAVEQFKDAFAEGAMFDPGFNAKLVAAGYVKSNPKCKEY